MGVGGAGEDCADGGVWRSSISRLCKDWDNIPGIELKSFGLEVAESYSLIEVRVVDALKRSDSLRDIAMVAEIVR